MTMRLPHSNTDKTAKEPDQKCPKKWEILPPGMGEIGNIGNIDLENYRIRS
jgi:hypothetical protein